MATGQKLRGLVGQSMSGQRRRPTMYSYSYTPGSYTWTCPASGWWRLVLWGAGAHGNGNQGGGSGALYIAERLLRKGQTVALVVGASAATAEASTATLPGGEVLTAGGGVDTGVAGAVTANRNLDIVYPGSAGGAPSASGTAGLGDAGGSGGAVSGAAGGGAGAPGYGNHRGGDGASALVNVGAEAPGGGGAGSVNFPGAGGHGAILIYRAKLPA